MKQLAKWFLAAAFAVAVAGGAQAQRQPGGGMMRAATPLQITLLTNEALQKELAITEDQKKALKEPMEKAAAFTKKQMELFSGGQPDREKMQELQKEVAAFTEETKAKVEKALDEKQNKRIKQIQVQMMGMAAFANEDVAKTLKITDEQKTKMKTVADDFAKERGDLQKEYGMGGRPMQGGARPDPEKVAEYTKKLKSLTDETFAKAAKELTADQAKSWKELVGETFDVSKLAPGRPMRRDN